MGGLAFKGQYLLYSNDKLTGIHSPFYVQNKGLYFVKWVGWPSADNTWEPMEHLDCREQLIDFYNRRLETRKVASPAE